METHINGDQQSYSENEATLAGGCFWCLEAVYVELRGIEQVVSGYAGGHVENPSYREVCNETTGHAEVVKIRFDPQQVTFRDILEVFFTIHDPTTLNQQGNDVGSQYRSAIYYHNEEQQLIAEEVIAALEAENLWGGAFTTEVAPLDKFYRAEDYHQDYFAQNGSALYCQFVIVPKVAKFRKEYLEKLKV